MTTLEPATLHAADDSRLVALAQALLTDQLVGALYVISAGTDWENYSCLPGVDEVALGVRLVANSGMTLHLSWGVPGASEGLELGLDRGEMRSVDGRVELLDVSDRPGWSETLNSSTETIAVSFFKHHDSQSIRPWALRMGFSAGSSVTIALGETGEHSIHYMPDSLVVIFGEKASRDYEVVDALQSAWGRSC